MQSEDKIKDQVRNRYARIAQAEPKASCCGSGPSTEGVFNIMSDDYRGLEGYVADADLGLGCGLPTQFARIQPGDTVVDLGSGAGNDCFVARHETGPTGKVIGIDFTPSMLDRARANARKLGFDNVEFLEGDIEQMPLPDDFAQVIVSNCVLNLVPGKARAFREIFRVLRPGGHFSVSDIVVVGELPEGLRHDAELYAGCVSGAIPQEEYLRLIADAGFTAVKVEAKKPIRLPDELLAKFLTPEEMRGFNTTGSGLFSISVYGEKPA